VAILLRGILGSSTRARPRLVTSRNFGKLEFGDAFQLDEKLYRKRSKYSAQLRRLASHEPMMTITRLVHLEIAESCASEMVSRCGSSELHA
jgi:hypothetical protein